MDDEVVEIVAGCPAVERAETDLVAFTPGSGTVAVGDDAEGLGARLGLAARNAARREAAG